MGGDIKIAHRMCGTLATPSQSRGLLDDPGMHQVVLNSPATGRGTGSGTSNLLIEEGSSDSPRALTGYTRLSILLNPDGIANNSGAERNR